MSSAGVDDPYSSYYLDARFNFDAAFLNNTRRRRIKSSRPDTCETEFSICDSNGRSYTRPSTSFSNPDFDLLSKLSGITTNGLQLLENDVANDLDDLIPFPEPVKTVWELLFAEFKKNHDYLNVLGFERDLKTFKHSSTEYGDITNFLYDSTLFMSQFYYRHSLLFNSSINLIDTLTQSKNSNKYYPSLLGSPRNLLLSLTFSSNAAYDMNISFSFFGLALQTLMSFDPKIWPIKMVYICFIPLKFGGYDTFKERAKRKTKSRKEKNPANEFEDVSNVADAISRKEDIRSMKTDSSFIAHVRRALWLMALFTKFQKIKDTNEAQDVWDLISEEIDHMVKKPGFKYKGLYMFVPRAYEAVDSKVVECFVNQMKAYSYRPMNTYEILAIFLEPFRNDTKLYRALINKSIKVEWNPSEFNDITPLLVRSNMPYQCTNPRVKTAINDFFEHANNAIISRRLNQPETMTRSGANTARSDTSGMSSSKAYKPGSLYDTDVCLAKERQKELEWRNGYEVCCTHESTSRPRTSTISNPRYTNNPLPPNDLYYKLLKFATARDITNDTTNTHPKEHNVVMKISEAGNNVRKDSIDPTSKVANVQNPKGFQPKASRKKRSKKVKLEMLHSDKEPASFFIGNTHLVPREIAKLKNIPSNESNSDNTITESYSESNNLPSHVKPASRPSGDSGNSPTLSTTGSMRKVGIENHNNVDTDIEMTEKNDNKSNSIQESPELRVSHSVKRIKSIKFVDDVEPERKPSRTATMASAQNYRHVSGRLNVIDDSNTLPLDIIGLLPDKNTVRDGAQSSQSNDSKDTRERQPQKILYESEHNDSLKRKEAQEQTQNLKEDASYEEIETSVEIESKKNENGYLTANDEEESKTKETTGNPSRTNTRKRIFLKLFGVGRDSSKSNVGSSNDPSWTSASPLTALIGEISKKNDTTGPESYSKRPQPENIIGGLSPQLPSSHCSEQEYLDIGSGAVASESPVASGESSGTSGFSFGTRDSAGFYAENHATTIESLQDQTSRKKRHISDLSVETHTSESLETLEFDDDQVASQFKDFIKKNKSPDFNSSSGESEGIQNYESIHTVPEANSGGTNSSTKTVVLAMSAATIDPDGPKSAAIFGFNSSQGRENTSPEKVIEGNLDDFNSIASRTRHRSVKEKKPDSPEWKLKAGKSNSVKKTPKDTTANGTNNNEKKNSNREKSRKKKKKCIEGKVAKKRMQLESLDTKTSNPTCEGGNGKSHLVSVMSKEFHDDNYTKNNISSEFKAQLKRIPSLDFSENEVPLTIQLPKLKDVSYSSNLSINYEDDLSNDDILMAGSLKASYTTEKFFEGLSKHGDISENNTFYECDGDIDMEHIPIELNEDELQMARIMNTIAETEFAGQSKINNINNTNTPENRRVSRLDEYITKAEDYCGGVSDKFQQRAADNSSGGVHDMVSGSFVLNETPNRFATKRRGNDKDAEKYDESASKLSSSSIHRKFSTSDYFPLEKYNEQKS